MMKNLFAAVCFGLLALPLCAEEINPQDWDFRLTGPGSGVQQTEDGFVLLYRAYAFSRAEWHDGSGVTFEWQPSKNVEGDDGQTYGDHLCVLIRATGAIRKKRSFEAADGIVVRIDASRGDVYVQTTKDGGESFTNLGFTKGSAPIDPNVFHSVSVLDTDGGVTVTIDKKVILTADVPKDPPKGNKWALYNREPVGPGTKVSRIREVNYTAPKKK